MPRHQISTRCRPADRALADALRRCGVTLVAAMRRGLRAYAREHADDPDVSAALWECDRDAAKRD